MSPKMLIYAGVNLHKWAQPLAKCTPAERSLFLADVRIGVGMKGEEGDVGYLPTLIPSSLLPTSPLHRSDRWGLIADCQADQSELQAW